MVHIYMCVYACTTMKMTDAANDGNDAIALQTRKEMNSPKNMCYFNIARNCKWDGTMGVRVHSIFVRH